MAEKNLPEPLVHRQAAIGLAMLCIVAVFAYSPMLSGGFVFDDYWNIVENNRISAPDTGLRYWTGVALGAEAGPLKRPLATLSFGLNYRLFGMDPWAFKATNLLLHLVCGWLVFLLTRRIIPWIHSSSADPRKNDLLALATAAIWLMHPIQMSTVAYAVQRMTILSTLFTLAGLLCYVRGRTRMIQDGRGFGAAIGWMMFFGVLASLSKESGALIVVYAMVIEATALRFAAGTALAQKRVRQAFSLAILASLLAALAYFSMSWESLARVYAQRTFSLSERLLTEARVLWSYIGWIFWPAPDSLGLHHDDIAISRGWLTPPSTLFAVIAWGAVICAAMVTRQRWPALCFGAAWFLGGHLLESTALPLEIAFEHRNYLPLVGVTLMVVVFADQVAANFDTRRTVSLAAFGGVLVIATALTQARASVWSDPLLHAVTEAEHHPRSGRAAYEAGREQLRGGGAESSERARAYFLRGMSLDDQDIHAAIGVLQSYAGATQVPMGAVDAAAQRIRTTHWLKVRPLLSIVQAAVVGRISLTQQQVETLITAVLDNPRANNIARADAFNALGHYHFNVTGDIQQAVSLTLMAAAQAPLAPVYRINAANLALSLGRPDIAKGHVDEAERLDRKRVYADDIAGLRQRLATFNSRQ